MSKHESYNINKILNDSPKYDYYLAEHLISELEKLFFEEWKQQDLYSFKNCLQKRWQDIEVCKTNLEPHSNRELLLYQVGKLEGILSVYESFWRDSIRNQTTFQDFIKRLSKIEGEFIKWRDGNVDLEAKDAIREGEAGQ